MRKTLLSVITLLSFGVQANAQKGTWLVYGNGSYDNASYTPTNNPYNYEAKNDLVTWNADAGFGRMVSDHFMVGLQGGYGSTAEDVLYPGPFYYYYQRGTVINWQAGVFCRYTSQMSKRFYVYGQAFAGKYGTSYKPNTSYGTPYPVPPYPTPEAVLPPDGNGFVVSAFPAVGMNIINGYGIHVDIGGISYNSYTATESSNQHHFNVTLGQQFSFGIHKVLGWKKLTAAKADTAPAVPAAK